MIEIVMLIALGFTVASLLALLIAPAFWRRAVKLTTREIEATLPITMAEINADKDLLRAEKAVEMRRLELSLQQQKERAARHLMERNRHMVEIGKLESEISSLKNTLAERTQAAGVLEQTVQKSIPELDAQLERTHKVLNARDQELAERARAYANQADALELSQTMIHRQEQEINRLREALESGSGESVKLWGMGADENKERAASARKTGKLNAELSRLREDLARLREIDMADAAELRAEMHRLADLMLSGTAAAKPKAHAAEPELTEPEPSEESPAAAGAQEKTPAETKASETKAARKTKRSVKPRKSLSQRLAGLKRKKQKEDA